MRNNRKKIQYFKENSLIALHNNTINGKNKFTQLADFLLYCSTELSRGYFCLAQYRFISLLVVYRIITVDKIKNYSKFCKF